LFWLFIILVTSRIFSEKIRLAIDLVNIILIAVIYTIILRKDIKQLISEIKGVGFPGLQIPISNLKERLNELEEHYEEDLKYSRRSNSDKPKSISDENRSIQSLNTGIEFTLSSIADVYRERSKHSKNVPIGTPKISRYLIENDVIGQEVYHLILAYWEIHDEYDNDKERRKLVEIGGRILSILKSIYQKIIDLNIHVSVDGKNFKGKPAKLEGGGTQFENVSENKVRVYTTLNILDSENNSFPLYNLDKNSFNVYEKGSDNRYYEAALISVKPIGVDIDLTLIISIDTSDSMNRSQKLIKAKTAVINLVDQIMGVIPRDRLKIAIHPFNTNMKDKFLLFNNNTIYTNDRTEIASRIDSLIAEGGTPLYDSVEFMTKIAKSETGYRMIVCISDGEEGHSERIDYNTMIDEVSKSNVPIYTIGYGTDTHLQVLIDIANLSGAGDINTGSFMDVVPSRLPNLLRFLATSSANIYSIEWEPTNKSPSNKVDCRIDIKYVTTRFGELDFSYSGLSYSKE
jgi:hypothetical protein